MGINQDKRDPMIANLNGEILDTRDNRTQELVYLLDSPEFRHQINVNGVAGNMGVYVGDR